MTIMSSKRRRLKRSVFKNILRKAVETPVDENDPFRKSYLRDHTPEPLLYEVSSGKPSAGEAVTETETENCLFCNQLFLLDNNGNSLPCRWDTKAKQIASSVTRGIIRRRSLPL